MFQSPQEAGERYFGYKWKSFERKNWLVNVRVAAGASQHQEQRAKERDCQQNRKDWEAQGYKYSWEKWEATGQQEEIWHSDKVRVMEKERIPEH